MDIKELKQWLTDPNTYPHECADIQLMETHISLVFLTGDYAYKVKKPVDFGFLDFSTLPKRRYYCEQEVVRNRVFAPDLYLQVLGLHIVNGRAALTETLEDAAEYVVQMQQFPQSDLLSLQVAAGTFTREDAHALGCQLAELHQGIAVAAADQQWGTLDAVRYPIEENFSQITPLLSDEDDQQRLQAIAAWSNHQLAALQDRFLQRKAQGYIRACHGDLHLNNILWRHHQAIPFDCIEFNEEFHWIDVMSELAFLLMDLTHQQEQELANHCLNGYLEISGDFDGIHLMPLYQCYRAMVRAKVAILRKQQGNLSHKEIAALNKEYRSYIELAEQFITANKPCLYITHGVSGSGKTTMARYVAGRLGAVHVRSDVERKRLFGFAANASSDSMLNAGIYSGEATVKTFQQLENVAKTMVAGGMSVIVDATFLKKEARQQFFEVAKQLGVPFAILDCAIDEQTARDRIRARMAAGRDASEADLKVLEQQLSHQDFLSPDEQRYVVVIDMGKPLEDIDIDTLIGCEQIAD